jgi:hypothetical protein
MASVHFLNVMNVPYLSCSIGLMMAHIRNGITPCSCGNFSDVTVWRVFAMAAGARNAIIRCAYRNAVLRLCLYSNRETRKKEYGTQSEEMSRLLATQYRVHTQNFGVEAVEFRDKITSSGK